MKLTGILFVFSSMIIPGIITMSLFRHIKTVMLGAPLIALTCVFIGLYFSYKVDTPTSPTIICFYGLSYLLLIIPKKLLKA
jgi:ABC-type Mn2+/Zn2+ transport system permease subunit